jgi:hypothetical protein
MSAAKTLCTLLLLLTVDAPARAGEASSVQPELRLNLQPRLLFDEAQRNAYLANSTAAEGPKPLSQAKLFESGDLSAALGNDGKIHYRLPSPSFLGTKLTGQIGTNSARLTLTWPPKN